MIKAQRLQYEKVVNYRSAGSSSIITHVHSLILFSIRKKHHACFIQSNFVCVLGVGTVYNRKLGTKRTSRKDTIVTCVLHVHNPLFENVTAFFGISLNFDVYKKYKFREIFISDGSVYDKKHSFLLYGPSSPTCKRENIHTYKI